MYEKLVRKLDKKPGTRSIVLCSEGGDLMAGLAMYDRLKDKSFTITATGENSSAATIVLQAAKIRRATPTTQFLFHNSRAEYIEDKRTEEQKQESDVICNHLDNVMWQVYSTRISCENIREAYQRKIFGAQTALRLGIIDEVWDGNR